MGALNVFDQLKAKGLKTDLSNFDQFRDFTNKQKRVKGFFYTSVVGTTEVRIDLSGTARLLLGMLFIKNGGLLDAVDPQVQFSLIINNEVVLQDVCVDSLSLMRLGQTEFFEYLRILSGTDSIKIQFTDVQALNYRVQFYYI